MNRRITEAALLGGGHESEHEVSLRSSATLRDALLATGRRVHPVLIGQDGTWNLMPPVAPGSPAAPFPRAVAGRHPGAAFAGSAAEGVTRLRSAGITTAVLGLHGRGGEDGTIQGFLETAGFAYTGSGVVASAAAIDKVLCKRLMTSAGLPTAPFLEVGEAAGPGAAPADAARWAAALGLPLVVKAPGLGSSVDVHIAATAEDAARAAAAVLASGPRALVERFVRGREFTVPVLGRAAESEALPVIEIVPRLASWFDAGSKYTPGGADEIVPAPIGPAETARLQELAVRLHRLVGARGVTRTDIIVDGSGEPWILEINTLPGMTAESLVPKASRAAGLPLSGLVERLLDDALAAAGPGSRAAEA